MSESELATVSLTAHEGLAIKESAYRQGLYQAWFATALEQTKSIFTLASAGVGLGLTLIFSDHVKPVQSWAPIWLLFATVAFALSAVFCIWVFRVNGRLVAKLLKDQEHESHETEDSLVGRVDTACRSSFGVGLVFLIFAAVAQIWL
ncbi:hypothetical protein [Roseateles albus]|uniref:DUF202 domain-containing protein n=1 Tax=Roseateles albus TaxID=2987525 RepID=A0ABT5KAG2_9BURK|nr:hypothetical protein [Roseateles albus]MDC8770934.1 hypothetical protein [Roseateles albus]